MILENNARRSSLGKTVKGDRQEWTGGDTVVWVEWRAWQLEWRGGAISPGKGRGYRGWRQEGVEEEARSLQPHRGACWRWSVADGCRCAGLST